MGEKNESCVIPLGIAAALPDPAHANSYLAVVRERRYWLVDCADSPITRLQQAGLDPLAVQGVIITHFHPDHVYGLPAYLLGLYLLGKKRPRPLEAPLRIYACPEVLSLVRAMIGLYQTHNWTGMFPLEYYPVPMKVGAKVAEDEDFVISAAPTHHSVPSIALRFVSQDSGRDFVYSSDTASCPEVETLARGATLLFHEATGAGYGHASAEEAGALAARAGVERLVLIHYASDATEQLLAEAQAVFAGPVELAQEFTRYYW